MIRGSSPQGIIVNVAKFHPRWCWSCFGFLLVNEGNWSLGSTWLIFALAVFAVSFAVGIGFLAPESARIARAIELHGVGSTEATRRIERIFLVSRIELLFLMLVVVDMVVKPGL